MPFVQECGVKATPASSLIHLYALESEARLLSVLRHPSLPAVSDWFVEDGLCCVVMDYVPGLTLGELLASRLVAAGRPFEPARVLLWADQLLDALEFLHTREPPVVHRDVKPDNLKLTPLGQVVLLDFGLAKGPEASLPWPDAGEGLRAAKDDEEKTEAFRTIAEVIREEIPVLPWAAVEERIVWQDDVHGIVFNHSTSFFLDKAWIG